jgi:hypothetical protein
MGAVRFPGLLEQIKERLAVDHGKRRKSLGGSRPQQHSGNRGKGREEGQKGIARQLGGRTIPL